MATLRMKGIQRRFEAGPVLHETQPVRLTGEILHPKKNSLSSGVAVALHRAVQEASWGIGTSRGKLSRGWTMCCRTG